MVIRRTSVEQHSFTFRGVNCLGVGRHAPIILFTSSSSLFRNWQAPSIVGAVNSWITVGKILENLSRDTIKERKQVDVDLMVCETENG